MVKRLGVVLSCVAATAFALQNVPLNSPSGTTIQGTVLQAPGGQPIRKANLQLTARDGQSRNQYSAVTDAEGRFKIGDVKPGRYIVMIDHPGFVQSPGGNRLSVPPHSDQGTIDLVFHMQPAAVITGKIVDLDGDPMRNVAVSATRAGSSLRRFSFHDAGNGVTNDLGEFRIPDLRAARYTITATPPQGTSAEHSSEKDNAKEHLIYTTTYYPGTLEKEQSVAVELHPGDETPVNFALLTSPAFRVTGTVAGISSKGLVEIMLSSKDHAEQSPQQLGEGGKFEFQNVLPGSYNVTLIVVSGMLTGGQPSIETMRVGEPIEVTRADVEGLRLQPNQGGAVRGRFRMDTGEKFDWTQLNIALFPVDELGFQVVMSGLSGLPAMSSVNKDGTFELKNVPSGNYQVVVGAGSNNLRDYITKSVIVDGRDVADSGFAVSPGMLLDVVVSAKGATIEGTVVDSKGMPVAYATVVDVPSAEHQKRPDLYQRDSTDERGHFSLRGLNPGKYTVLAFDDLEEDVRQPEFSKSYEGRGEQVQLDEGARSSVTLKLIPADAEAP